MARSDWIALITDATMEYAARVDLERFGLRPYLPQFQKRWLPPHGGALTRRHPLFPRYILLPVAEAEHRALRHARGLRKVRPILADDSGRPWRCPSAIVNAIRLAESAGEFDELLLVGDQVRLTHGLLACVSARMAGTSGTRVELLLPLFNGCRATISAARLTRA